MDWLGDDERHAVLDADGLDRAQAVVLCADDPSSLAGERPPRGQASAARSCEQLDRDGPASFGVVALVARAQPGIVDEAAESKPSTEQSADEAIDEAQCALLSESPRRTFPGPQREPPHRRRGRA